MTSTPETIGIIGGGSFGQGLAKACARSHHPTLMWSRRFLGTKTPAQCSGQTRVTQDLNELKNVELIFLCVPSSYISEIVSQLDAALDAKHIVVHVSRGLIGDGLETVSSYLKRHSSVRKIGALAGPLNSKALELNSPTGAVLGSHYPEVSKLVRKVFQENHIRLYDTKDTLGVELSSAFVGLMALAFGYAGALKVGPESLAVFLTRGMTELIRIALSLGADPNTLMGLSGYGDLLSASMNDGRPEMLLGEGLAKGLDLEEAGKNAGANIEGVHIAHRVLAYAAKHHIDVPITRVISMVLQKQMTPEMAMAALISRETYRE